MRLEGKLFVGNEVDGDFKFMLNDPAYEDAVLIFNDNVVDASAEVTVNGAGSASIRRASARYNAEGKPRAFGIPTGWSVQSGAFKADTVNLEFFAARAIIVEIERLVLILRSRGASVRRLVFSCDANDPTRIGTGIFDVSAAVVDFIMVKLREVPSRVADTEGGSKFSMARINDLSKQVQCVAALHTKLAISLQSARYGKRMRDESQFIVKAVPLLPDQVLLRGLHYIGKNAQGHAVYEKCAFSSPYFM